MTQLTFAEIRKQPTHYGPSVGGGIHESSFRSWLVLEKVRQLLEQETPPAVILELIDDMTTATSVRLDSDA